MKICLPYKEFRRMNWTRGLAMLAGIIAMISCEDIMDVKFSGDSAKNLVVEGSITTDTMAHHVRLSYTSDYFGAQDTIAASGAQVSITDGTTVFPLSELTDGDYYTDIHVHGDTGKTYTLQIKLPDGREYTASDELHSCNQFDSIRQSANYNTLFSGYGYDVLFFGREPEPAGNYYMYLLYLDHKLYSDTITEISFVDDEFVNGSYVREFAVYRIREVDMMKNPVDVSLEMYSISKQYYEFMSALMAETVWRGSPWDGPPANIPGNVSNGATGFFRASDVKRRWKQFLPLPRAN
jgi:hypothetical protein